MRDIAITFTLDENRDVGTIQDLKASNAYKIDGMDLIGSVHATHSQTLVDFHLSSQPSAYERVDRSAADEALAAMISATPETTPDKYDELF